MTIRTIDISTGEVTERELTEEEIAALPAPVEPTPPTPLEQIRALERQYADDTAKITRQTLLMATVAAAMERPEAVALTAGMTQEEAQVAVIQLLLATDHGFKLMYDLEQAIAPLRAQIA